MKKILRLVTTSVLTLTLVACGEASSSVSNGTTTSSSVSSVSSAFANVSTITLSAASDVLTQTMGTQKAVVVQAALNANTNPSLALEWFVNGTKSNQTGRVFEYTPAAAGTFVITARVGSVVSNALTLNVGAPTLAITGEVKVVDADTIEITAPGGATVAVTNNEVLETSMYDLAKGIYVINLKTALKQGDTATVTLTREGLAPVSKAFTFDTRVVAVSTISGGTATDNKDGSYDILRPHTLGSTEVTNTTVVTYSVNFEATNMKDTSLAYKFETVSVPTGATALATAEGLLSVAGDTKSPAGSFTFTLNKDSIPGAYVYRYTVGGKSNTVTINVKDPAPAIKFVQYQYTSSTAAIFASETATAGVTTKFDVIYTKGTKADLYGVAANADGSYDIVKEYLKDPLAYKTFQFKLLGEFFDVPTNLLDQSGVTPNQLQLTVVGPDGLPLMRTQYKAQLDLPIMSTGFRSGFAHGAGSGQLNTISQVIDAATPVGKYTYTVRVLQLGTEIYKKEVVVNVKDFTSSIELLGFTNNATSAFNAAETQIVSRMNLPATTSTAFTTNVVATTGVRDTVATAFDTALKATAILSLTKVAGLDFDTFTNTLQKEFVDEFLVEFPYLNGTRNTPQTFAGLNATYSVDTDAYKALLLTFFNPYTDIATAGANTTESVFFDADLATAKTKYLALRTAYRDALLAALTPYPAAKPTTQAEFDAGLAAYKASIANLFTYAQYVGNSARAAVKVGADGFYEIEKPIAQTLDTRSIVFDLKVTNFESPAAPAAALASSFTGKDSVKKELLTFVKTVSGPGILPNAAFNTANTRVAVELNYGSNSAVDIENLATPAVKYNLYRAPAHVEAYTAAANTLTIGNIFALDVRNLTVNGEYVFTVNLGSKTETVKVRVVNATPKLDFTLDEADTTNNNFLFNKTTGKYHATFNASGTALRAEFKIDLSDMTVGTDNLVSYSLVRKYPKVTNEFNNTAVTKLKDEVANVNSGVRVINDAVASGTALLNLLRIGVASNGVQYLEFSEAGEYVFDLTINGVKETITLVAQKYPTITVTSVSNSGNELKSVTISDVTTYIVPDAMKSVLVKGTGVSLPAANVFYKLTANSTATVGSAINDIDGAAATLTSNGLVALNLTTGISVQLLTDSGVTGLITANATWGADEVGTVTITIYERVVDTATTPVAPVYDFKVIGHTHIRLWNNPTVGANFA